jgi:hypothetical protein
MKSRPMPLGHLLKSCREVSQKGWFKDHFEALEFIFSSGDSFESLKNVIKMTLSVDPARKG